MKEKDLVVKVIDIALAAGAEILNIYQQDFAVEYKEDNSPLTKADLASNNVIVNGLSLLTPEINILSEESKQIPYEQRQDWNEFWLVDPLDGTKEFVKKNGEFTVNIALIRNNRPVLGVIYAPVLRQLFFATGEDGSFKFELNEEAISGALIWEKAISLPHTVNTDPSSFTIVASRSHPSPETEAYLAKLAGEYQTVNSISVGSSLKLCLVAEGKADCYPRFGPTMEWDTAAGQAIAEFSGCQVINNESGKAMHYNKENLLNPWFIVSR